MSHIDEGTLHAYLDGALDLYPEDEAQHVRQHLESCAECQRRLEEERAIREEAGSILAMAAPDVSAPPLEELRAEAVRRGTEEQRRGLSRMNRWAWAASVVLALGTGWMLRGSIGGWISQPGPDQAAEPSVAQPAASDGAAREAESPEQAQVGAVLDATAEEEADEIQAEGPGASDADATGAGASGAGAAEAGAPAGRGAAAQEDTRARSGAEPMALTETMDSAPGMKTDSLALPPPRRAQVETLSAAARVEAAPTTADLAGGLRREAAELPAPAEGPTEGELLTVQGRASVPVVPGLEVLDMSYVSIPDVGGGTQVRQLSTDGDELVLVHFAQDVEPPMERIFPAAEGEEVIVQRDGGWTLLRGPFTRQELLDFGASMTAGG